MWRVCGVYKMCSVLCSQASESNNSSRAFAVYMIRCQRNTLWVYTFQAAGYHLLIGISPQTLPQVYVLNLFLTVSPFRFPAEDGIFAAFLQKGIAFLLNPIKCIYRTSLDLRYIPMAWKIARIEFIPKRGKTDYTTAKSFRPISLTSISLKELEKLMDR